MKILPPGHCLSMTWIGLLAPGVADKGGIQQSIVGEPGDTAHLGWVNRAVDHGGKIAPDQYLAVVSPITAPRFAVKEIDVGRRAAGGSEGFIQGAGAGEAGIKPRRGPLVQDISGHGVQAPHPPPTIDPDIDAAGDGDLGVEGWVQGAVGVQPGEAGAGLHDVTCIGDLGEISRDQDLPVFVPLIDHGKIGEGAVCFQYYGVEGAIQGAVLVEPGQAGAGDIAGDVPEITGNQELAVAPLKADGPDRPIRIGSEGGIRRTVEVKPGKSAVIFAAKA